MYNNRSEFPNLAIVSVVLREFVGPFIDVLESDYPTPEEKLEGVRNAALDEGNEEIVAMCNYIELQELTRTFFPE